MIEIVSMIALVVMSLVALGLWLAWSRTDASMNVDGLIAQGHLHLQQNDLIQAEMKLEKALKELESSRKPDASKMVGCLVHLAHVYERSGKQDRIGDLYDSVLNNWKAQLARNELSTVDIDYAISNYDFGPATYIVSEFYIDNVIPLRERTLPSGHPDIRNSHLLGARLLRKAGYEAEADLLESRSSQ